jgi:hypothetical protein
MTHSKSKLLRVERPNKPVEEYRWDDDSKRRFYLEDNEIERLESGEVLWRGFTALSLEDELILD